MRSKELEVSIKVIKGFYLANVWLKYIELCDIHQANINNQLLLLLKN